MVTYCELQLLQDFILLASSLMNALKKNQKRPWEIITILVLATIVALLISFWPPMRVLFFPDAIARERCGSSLCYVHSFEWLDAYSLFFLITPTLLSIVSAFICRRFGGMAVIAGTILSIIITFILLKRVPFEAINHECGFFTCEEGESVIATIGSAAAFVFGCVVGVIRLKDAKKN